MKSLPQITQQVKRLLYSQHTAQDLSYWGTLIRYLLMNKQTGLGVKALYPPPRHFSRVVKGRKSLHAQWYLLESSLQLWRDNGIIILSLKQENRLINFFYQLDEPPDIHSLNTYLPICDSVFENRKPILVESFQETSLIRSKLKPQLCFTELLLEIHRFHCYRNVTRQGKCLAGYSGVKHRAGHSIPKS